MILDDPSGLCVITSVLKYRKEKWKNRTSDARQKRLDAPLFALNTEWRGLWAKEFGKPLEAREGKDIDFPLEPMERNTVPQF